MGACTGVLIMHGCADGCANGYAHASDHRCAQPWMVAGSEVCTLARKGVRMDVCAHASFAVQMNAHGCVHSCVLVCVHMVSAEMGCVCKL
jgi:hypothetical protein